MKKTDIEELRKRIVDSCGWIEYFKGGDLAESFGEHIEDLNRSNSFTPTIIIYEVYKVFLRNYTDDDALKAVSHIKKNTTIIPLDDRIAISAAELSSQLRIPMADAIVLATARDLNSIVITSDTDLKGLNDVLYISSQAERNSSSSLRIGT
ncbi:MAG: type II toxin-antitoxin system VapC family toxin [Thermoplasmatota archaeon]